MQGHFWISTVLLLLISDYLLPGLSYYLLVEDFKQPNINTIKIAFRQTSINSQSLVNLSDKDEITFKVIEKHRYGLPKTVSKHLNFTRSTFIAKPGVAVMRRSNINKLKPANG